MKSRYAASWLAGCLALASCGQTATSAAPTRANSAGVQTMSATPQKIGDCVRTAVTDVGTRLEAPDEKGVMRAVPGSGSAISYANGIDGVSYESVPGIDNSRVGDAIELCLTSLPQDCPPGDDRGKTYTARNIRTGATWTVPDAEHMCGGA